MTLSTAIAAALTATPPTGLPASMDAITYRDQYDTAEHAAPMLIITETGSENLTQSSLRKKTWEARLYTSPDDTPPADAPAALEIIELHLRTSAFRTALKAQLPDTHALLHWTVLGVPPIKIDDRIVTDTITGHAHLGVNAPAGD